MYQYFLTIFDCFPGKGKLLRSIKKCRLAMAKHVQLVEERKETIALLQARREKLWPELKNVPDILNEYQGFVKETSDWLDRLENIELQSVLTVLLCRIQTIIDRVDHITYTFTLINSTLKDQEYIDDLLSDLASAQTPSQ